MIVKGFSNNEIADLTGLSEEKIEKLREIKKDK